MTKSKSSKSLKSSRPMTSKRTLKRIDKIKLENKSFVQKIMQNTLLKKQHTSRRSLKHIKSDRNITVEKLDNNR